jgi:cation diffusion facilitator CzcD-associated flavoprotein CzcO
MVRSLENEHDPAHGPRVAIIGAGFSGIAAAIALRKRGLDNFVIFESADGIGGTWWKNRYPGAEVDLESHIYSFSYERNDWTRTHADWRQLQAYLERTASKWGLLGHVRLREKVETVTWDDETNEYWLTTSDGPSDARFDAVISAVGFLNIPLIPPFARGDSTFEGDVCHTSTWRDGLSMAGKTVGIVGTGSSAVQIVQEALREADHVKIFQLEPNWVLPKGSREFTALERRLNRIPLVYRWRRWRLYLGYDSRQWRASHARANGRSNRRRKLAALDFLKTSLASRPDLLEDSTPAFAFEARRTVISDTYYPALLDPKVTLVPHGVKELTEHGVVDANGDEHELDMVVLATGFDAANYLGTYRVFGLGGAELHDVWHNEPRAFLGLMMPGFPNFFMMYGPNTNSVPLVNFYEAQAAFAGDIIGRLQRRVGSKRAAVRPWVMAAYDEWLQSRLDKTVWKTTDSYFKSGTGRIVSQWPFGVTSYVLATKLLRKIAVRFD